MGHATSPDRLRHQGTGPYFVEAVGKAIDIIWTFQDYPKGLTIDQIVTATRISKSTTYRLLCTLVEGGMVDVDQERERYRVSPRMFRLTNSVQPDLRTAAEPEMRRFWNTVKETVNLGIIDQGEVLYLIKIASPHAFRLEVSEGTRAPVHSTALGKAMAAGMHPSRLESILREHPLKKFTPNTITTERRFWKELEKIRAQGYATEEQETMLGGGCVAVAICDANNEAVGAVSVSAPIARMKVPPPQSLIEALKHTCEQISHKLGWQRQVTTG
jgi:IclR family acetate operon transcriptional repressor